MGKFKRLKSRPRVEKRFVSTSTVFSFIIRNKKKLEALPKEVFQIEKIDFEQTYESFCTEYLIIFNDKSAYLVGREVRIKDEEDWAQAESIELYYCLDYYQERGNIPALEVMEKLEKLVEDL